MDSYKTLKFLGPLAALLIFVGCAPAQASSCGPVHVDAVQSRIYQQATVQWCDNIPLHFKSIGKGKPEQTTSSIANIDGRLFDYTSQMFYENGHWRRLTPGEKNSVNDGLIVNVQKRNGTTYKFVLYAKRCAGVSLFSDQGYHGTYSSDDWVQWSALYTDGKIIAANIGRLMRLGPVPPATRSTECHHLDLTPVSNFNDWVYAIFPIGPSKLLYGGFAQKPEECAQLRILDTVSRKVETIYLPECQDWQVSEIYSMTKWGDEILVGTYPKGTLYAFNPSSHAVRPTKIAAPSEDDWTGGGKHYRESQSLLVINDHLFIGMYPWAELIVFDGKQTTSTRILKEPAKSAAEKAPFFNHLKGRQTWLDKFRGEDYMRSVNLSTTAWGQRIPSITILDSRLCVSTGGMTGNSFNSKIEPISKDAAQHYGEVFCTEDLVDSQ